LEVTNTSSTPIDEENPEKPLGEIASVTEESEENTSGDVAVKPSTSRRGASVFLALVLGGAVSCGIGFFAARYVVPEGWPFPGVTPEPDPDVVAQAEQGERLNDLEEITSSLGETVTALEAGQALLQADQSVQDLAAKLATAEGRLTELQSLLATLEDRLSQLEKIPQGSGIEAAEAAAAAYERELSAMREMLAGELAQIRAEGEAARVTQLDAEGVARQTALLTALSHLHAATESGQPFEDVLAEIRSASNQDIPEALVIAAPQGVPTLAMLQDVFPDAARAALDASVAKAIEDGTVGWFSGFLQSQLGTRSLEPKEGDDPDAILSRAEGALKQGLILPALEEIASLPETGRAEMMAWVAMAQSRLGVLDAIDTLTDQMNEE